MAMNGPKRAAPPSGKRQPSPRARKGRRPSSRVDGGGQRLVEPTEPKHQALGDPSRLDGGRAGVSGRAAKLRAAALAAGCALVASTHAVAAHRGGTHRPQPPPAQSQAEIASELDRLEQSILSNVPMKQDLQNELSQFYTKSDVDGLLDQIRKGLPQQAVTQPELSAAITKLDGETQERDRQLRKALEGRTKNLGGEASTIPSWVSLGVSLASLCAAAWVGWKSKANVPTNAAAMERARPIARAERTDRVVDEYAGQPSGQHGPTI